MEDIGSSKDLHDVSVVVSEARASSIVATTCVLLPTVPYDWHWDTEGYTDDSQIIHQNTLDFYLPLITD